MLRADSKLWVPVSTKYNGFAFEPTKGWLTNANANAKASAEHSRHTNKEKSTISRNTKTTVNVC
tara:strand:- start:77 stop:268 length:192 start_codon:yes stop_codon:yes gene_type:complete